MLMVRLLLNDSTEGCSATQVYFPSSWALTFFSVSLEEGRIQSSPWKRERESNGDTQQSVGESDKREAEQNRTNIFDWLDCGLKRINKVWQITIILSRELESTRCWSVNERDTRERRGRKCCFGRVVRNVKKRDRVTGQETLATSATQIERQKYLPVPGPRRTVPPKSQMKCIYLSSNPSDWTHIDTSQ